MARRGAQPGNKNASKGRPWEAAIRRALSRAAGTIDRGLDRVADKLVAAAMDGDSFARTEIANRLDGKPTEHVRIDQDVTVNVGSSEELVPGLTRALELRTKPSVQ